MEAYFSEFAKSELDDAIDYLELEYEGLGRRFKVEIEAAVQRILRFPWAWSVERGTVRKCLVHTFPYKILYSIEVDHIFVIAVAHQHRRPYYWIDRLDD